jgi:hypothetical protein
MDVDGFDPYEDEYDWRDALEVMGEKFQEALDEKGVTRKLPEPHYGYHAVVGPDGLFRAEPILPGTVIHTADGGMRVFGNGKWEPYTGQTLEELVDDDDWVPEQERFHFTGF